jgi:hypothetical protein
VQIELKIQAEILREELKRKICGLFNMRKADAKHLSFPMPRLCNTFVDKAGDRFALYTHKVPPNGKFTNYPVLFQKLDTQRSKLGNLA